MLNDSRMVRILLIFALLLLVACQPQSNQSVLESDEARQAFLDHRVALESEFQDCERNSTTIGAALVADARCMIYTVAENPAEPEGRQIDLKLMVLPSIRLQPESDPFLILVGGPGESATEAGVSLVPTFGRIRQDRDIVLVDQRGTGTLSPFDCDFGEEDEALQLETNIDEVLLKQSEYLNACLDQIDASPEYYTTDIAVQDLEEIREFLGYSQLNLWGGSYGTRVALAFLQAFPDSSRTIVIDGVAPPGLLPLGPVTDASASLASVFAFCALEEFCAEAFPSLQRDYGELMARLQTPEPVSMRNFKDGTTLEFEMTAAAVQNALFTMLYSREATRLIPLVIEELYKGNYQILAGLGGGGAGGANAGMHFSVICSEDITQIDQEEIDAALNSDEFLTVEWLIRPRLSACEIWPSREIDPAYFAPVVSDKPVLILSGTQDPVTPRRWGDLVAETLSNSRHIVADGIGHITSRYGCASDLIFEFVDTADSQNLDIECINELGPRPFFNTLGGSTGGTSEVTESEVTESEVVNSDSEESGSEDD